MAEVSRDQLKEAVESQHGGTATFVQFVPVHEEQNGQIVWDGSVAVFNLRDSPTKAWRAYAWPYERPDGNLRFIAILDAGPIKGPRDAVRAAIMAEAGGGGMK